MLLENIALDLISEDGLGTVHLDPTDSSGAVDAAIAPGNWNIELNLTENQIRWVVNATNDSSFLIAAGNNPSLNITASKSVELSGNVYWDFNEDNNSDIAEGLAEASVHLSSEDANISLVTDAGGY